MPATAGVSPPARAAAPEPELARRGFLIGGSGSIGRRHCENLGRLGCTDVRFFRTGLRDAAAPPVAAPSEFDLAAALERRPKAVFVCNPTAQHLGLALAAARAGAHLLIEKPVADRPEGVGDLEREVRSRGLIALVGFQYRFHPGLRQIREWLAQGAIGRLVSGVVHWGEYLPAWHPGEDWRRGYAARADLGGGAIRTLCHPFDYLRWMLGEVDWVWAETSNRALGLDVEDCAQVGLCFASGVAITVCLDYLRQPRDHRLELVGTRGRIAWSEAGGMAELFGAEAGRTAVPVPSGFDRNTMFIEELRHFLDCVDGAAAPDCSLPDGIAALEIATAALESARSGRRVRARRHA